MKHVTARATLSAGIGLLITMVCLEYTWGFLFSAAGIALGYWQYKASQKKHSRSTMWQEHVFPENEEEVALLLNLEFGWKWEEIQRVGADEKMLQKAHHRYITDERNDFLASQRNIKEEIEKRRREKEIEYRQRDEMMEKRRREKELEKNQREVEIRKMLRKADGTVYEVNTPIGTLRGTFRGRYSENRTYVKGDIVWFRDSSREVAMSRVFYCNADKAYGFPPIKNSIRQIREWLEIEKWLEIENPTKAPVAKNEHEPKCCCPTCMQKIRSILSDIEEEREMLFKQNGGRWELRVMTVRQTYEILHGRNCLCSSCCELAQNEVEREKERRVYKCIDKHFPLSSEEIADEIRREKIKEM